MSNARVAQMSALHGNPIPLQGVHLSGSIDLGLLELTVEQRYTNVESESIEAVYTFPLPLDAVLLSFEIEIGERRLAGVVNRKREAAETYEDAVAAGDTAALLEHSRDGLYTVSLGNLGAGEAAVVRFRFAQLLSFDGGRLRAAIPTAIAPRYGHAEAALSAHQVPVTDLQAEYPLSLELAIRGPLAGAPISSPSHSLIKSDTDGGICLQLETNATLDRDLVILIEHAAVGSKAVVAQDGDGYVGLLTLQVPARDPAAAKPRHLKLLVDCSGSMQGDGIQQAANGLATVIASLKAGDQVSLTRFGSHVEPVTKGLQAITPARRSRLNQRIQSLRADLGGTELASAITAVLNIPVPESAHADILLITDGEVWDLDGLLQQVARSAQRLFVIAVSATPVEELARKIASTTGGACEFVTPGEDMRAAVNRQLQRMAAPAHRIRAVDWGAPAEWTVGTQCAIYAGDTVHLLAGFKTLPTGSAEVRIGADEDASITTLSSDWSSTVLADNTLARLAAARRLVGLTGDAGAVLAEQYSLVSPWTSCVVVMVHDDGNKAAGSPALRTVPQMMVAGHMGSGVDRLGGVVAMQRRGLSRPFMASIRPISVDDASPVYMSLASPAGEDVEGNEQALNPSTMQSETQYLHELNDRLRELKDLIKREEQKYESRRHQQMQQLADVHRHLQSVEKQIHADSERFGNAWQTSIGMLLPSQWKLAGSKQHSRTVIPDQILILMSRHRSFSDLPSSSTSRVNCRQPSVT